MYLRFRVRIPLTAFFKKFHSRNRTHTLLICNNLQNIFFYKKVSSQKEVQTHFEVISLELWDLFYDCIFFEFSTCWAWNFFKEEILWKISEAAGREKDFYKLWPIIAWDKRKGVYMREEKEKSLNLIIYRTFPLNFLWTCLLLFFCFFC